MPLDQSAIPDLRLSHQTTPAIIAIVDPFQLSRECLSGALGTMHPQPEIVGFASAGALLDVLDERVGLIVYVWHDTCASNTGVAEMMTIRRVTAAPIIVVTDSHGAEPAERIRRLINDGARGVVVAETTGIAMVQAAIRFVQDGGTFVQVDQLLTPKADIPAGKPMRALPPHKLTTRQVDVLRQLRQGKPNKIIAFELRMSESTVKVHVRNVMRKLNATNRTQVAYKAQALLMDFDGGTQEG